jgi:hypothetical protein
MILKKSRGNSFGRAGASAPACKLADIVLSYLDEEIEQSSNGAAHDGSAAHDERASPFRDCPYTRLKQP